MPPRRLPRQKMTRLHWLLVVLGLLFLATLISAPFQYRPPDPAAAAPARPHGTHPPASAPEDQDGKWLIGGRLHDVSLLTWQGATPENKLATAGDWLLGSTWKGRVNDGHDMSLLKDAAKRLVRAVDTVANTGKADFQNSGQIAALIIRTANDSGPPGSSVPVLAEWWKGGTLHNANIAAWRAATQENKVATAGDWLWRTKWKGNIGSRSDLDRLKIKATNLAHAVDTVVSEPKLNDANTGMGAAEIAAALLVMTKDFDP
jgi:hypothetical protein